MQSTSSIIDDSFAYATFRRRLTAWAIDWVVVTVAGGIIGYCCSFLIPLIGVVIAAAAAIGYHCGFESSKFQATPGKMLLGLKVTDINGQRVNFWRALARYWGMAVSNMTFGIGYLMILNTQKHQALHDKIANCLVVRAPKVLGCGDHFNQSAG